MIYDLNISKSNRQAHVDIESDMEKQKNGTFTFTLRLNSGNIVDYTKVEYADARKYLILKEIIIQEFALPPDPSLRNESTSVRLDDSEY